MEEERLLVRNQVLIEAEAAGQLRHGGADAIDPVLDLVDPRAGFVIGDCHLLALPLAAVRTTLGSCELNRDPILVLPSKLSGGAGRGHTRSLVSSRRTGGCNGQQPDYCAGS